MSPPDPHLTDLMLEHRGFLMGLARSLVVDEQHAEDVVQEAYLAALRGTPPPRARLRAWLTGVTRNLALRSRRTQGRQHRRESAVSRSEAVPGTADVAARLEIQKQIADAVAALEEPGRTAVVWRYFDGLPPREIAHRAGVSVRTIESRLRRARETLRSRLDEQHGGALRSGSRARWCAVLLPIVAPDLPASMTSTAAAATAASPVTATTSAVGGLAAAATLGATLVSTKILVGAAALCVAAAFYAGRESAPARVSSSLTDTPTSTQDDTGGPTLEGADLAKVVAQRDVVLQEVRKELAALRTENEGLRTKLEAAAQSKSTPEGPAAIADGGARLGGEKYKQVLDAIEWPEAGEAAAHMVPLLADLAVAFDKGARPPENIGMEIFKWNQKLQKVAVEAVTAKTPGTGGNGAFTHPVVSLNLIAATLEQGGLPLEERQRDKLFEIGDRFLAEDDRRLGGYNEETFQLEKTIAECDLKDRMFAEVDAMLSEEQREFLHPATLRGRLGVDIFCSGVIYYTIARPVDFQTRDDLAAGLVAQYKSHENLSDADVEPFLPLAKEWADGFAETTLQASGDAITVESRKSSGGMLAGWQPVANAREAAVRQLELNRALYERLRGNESDRKALRASAMIYMPVKRP
jgi:RNA polymerase sigma-70 factor (ECF subfamily)